MVERRKETKFQNEEIHKQSEEKQRNAYLWQQEVKKVGFKEKRFTNRVNINKGISICGR